MVTARGTSARHRSMLNSSEIGSRQSPGAPEQRRARSDPATFSVVVLTHNRVQALCRCIDSILRSDYPNTELIVVDDASSDGTEQVVRQRYPACKIIRHDTPLLTCAGIKEGLRGSSGEYVLIIDDDNVLDEGALTGLAELFRMDPTIAVAGPVCYYLDHPNTIMYAGAILAPFTRRNQFVLGNVEDVGQVGEYIDVDMFPNCFAVRKESVLNIELPDENRLPFFNDDAALQYRLKRTGLRVVATSHARIWHDYPYSSMDTRTGTSRMRVYYMVRSKIFFERDVDSPSGRFRFFLVYPLYVLGYLRLIAVADTRLSVKMSMLAVLGQAILHGLLGVTGRQYVE